MARAGDARAATKLDRLARSVTHLGDIIAAPEPKGVAVEVVRRFGHG